MQPTQRVVFRQDVSSFQPHVKTPSDCVGSPRALSWTLGRESASTRAMRALIAGFLVGSLSVACSTKPPRNFMGSTDEGSSGEGGAGGEPTGASEGGGKTSRVGEAGSGGEPGSGGQAGAKTTPDGPSSCAEDEYDDGTSCRKLTICAGDE